MIQQQPLREVADLTDAKRNLIFNMSVADARACVGSGDVSRVAEIDGHFALLSQEGHLVRMARSIGLPMRYFIAKLKDGPALVVSDRIDAIAEWLRGRGLIEQFHPSYTRMVPAHYITEIALVGCPDPSPRYERFFTPPRESLPADIDAIGKAYIGTVYQEVNKWLDRVDGQDTPAGDEPIGVCFSGGIDSGSVFLLVYHALLSRGANPARLKAFTLTIDGGGDDLAQARGFLDAVKLPMFLEPIEATAEDLDLAEATKIIEDYKPLDIQAGAMVYALCRGIRARYPQWRLLIDGDGGDENLKDYPIEENPELTIRSVLNNALLYHEGWGVEAIKHSLTYSGGLSRSYTRTYAPASHCGFTGFSPFTLPHVIQVSEGIPFIELTGWNHDRLYSLKGEIVSRGVKAVTGIDMPVFAKRRFQHGAITPARLKGRFPDSPAIYRRTFDAVCGV